MRRVARDAYAHYVPRIGREPAPMTADYDQAITRGQAWVAEQRGQLVGLLVLVPADDHLLLENIAVAPNRQASGIGALLLNKAEEQAYASGLTEIRLYTNQAMTENLAYYPRHGYHETHRTTQDGYRRVYFAKTIYST
jgi:GNAT superfamily N-acetyltransferase